MSTTRTPTRALVPWWVLLALIAFVQSPGRTVADTKHNLTENPLGFLANSLTMWSETMPLGQLQNQAYGYLFPQGAFFGLFDATTQLLPDYLHDAWNIDWVGQALWWSLTLILAFTGLYRVAEAASVGTHTSRIVAALLYAFSPRIITTLGAISSEAWPVALAPWILLPVLRVVLARDVVGTRRATIAVLLSGVAVLSTGAVNAVSTAAACVPTALVLIGAALFGPHRRRGWTMFAGWVASCAAVSIWWLVPLLLLGRYSPPFTDYIESSGVTTRWLNLTETLRGTTSWTPFVSTERIGGHALVAEPILIYATIAIMGLGLLGLAMRSMPHRRMWWVVALAGIVVMSSWTEPFGLFGASGRSLLDGSLAAIRNLHKFDPVLRLPLMLGVAHAIAQLPLVPWKRENRAAWLHPERNVAGIAAMMVLIAFAGATAPAWSVRLAPEGSFERVPSYWQDTADWLNTNAQGSRTLLMPSTPFALQEWGNTRDEPLQPLADVPWVVRDAVPLVPPEAIRGLDGLRDSFARGVGNDALAATLNNNGIGYVVVRSDLGGKYRTDSKKMVQQTLEDSPAMLKVAEFTDHDASDSADAAEAAGSSSTKIQIWRAGESAGAVANLLSPRLIDTANIPLVAGGPEVLSRLDQVDKDAPVRMLAGVDAGTVTDTPALRGRNYGEITRAVSGILATDEDAKVRNKIADYPVDGLPLTTTATGRGELEASSSASNPFNVGGAASEHSLNALVDGDDTTWWQPATGTGQAEWVEARFESPRKGVVVTLTGAVVPVEVQVKSSTTTTNKVLYPGEETRIAVPGAETDRIRVTAVSAPVGFTLAEMRITAAGEDITPIRVPTVPDSSKVVQRWSFGQEVREGTLTRMFSVPTDTTVSVSADTCDTGVGDPWTSLERIGGGFERTELTCEDTYPLSAGMYRLESKADWVTLTSNQFRAPTRAEQNVAVLHDDRLDAAPTDRILWRPISVNKGMVATVAGGEGGDQPITLTPVTINGWQQGWVVPAGMSGTVTIAYEPASTWRNGILAGGAIAAVFALVTLALAYLWRAELRRDFTLVDNADTVPAWFVLACGAVTATLVSGLPGLAVAAATSGAAWFARKKLAEETYRHGMIATLGVLVAAMALLLGTNPWPQSGYAGAGWLLQLIATAAVCVTTLLVAPSSSPTNVEQAPRRGHMMPLPSE
ncbi:DUF3367 domain-containing protein [Corynebacterium sp. H113]|uniref:DUF3367 domain-containing protein n=1 Tax=Corynebacterium sp. H113 TaxID=3133419 RepID=UPI0030A8D892